MPEDARGDESKESSEPKSIAEHANSKSTIVKPVPKPEVSTTEPITTAKSAIPLEVLKRRPLHLMFGENTWAEVIDGHGVVLLSRNNPRGSEKWVGGPKHAPYDISISHPAHVKLYYMGKLIDLSAYAGMEVAHLKVE